MKFKFNISRGGRPRKIVIETEYADSVDLPLLKHTFPLTRAGRRGHLTSPGSHRDARWILPQSR